MKRAAAVAAAAVFWPSTGSAQDAWKAVEVVEPYAISGTTAPELYRSIGERGPKSSLGRVIAQTRYVLRWERTFDHTGGACTVLTATPKLTITYTLPKPSQTLSAPLRERWARFIDGIARHEHVHGDHARDVAREAVRATVGLSVPDDPKCVKIRKLLAREITAQVAVQRARGRDFDRVEMSAGGNIQTLVLDFLNGT